MNEILTVLGWLVLVVIMVMVALTTFFMIWNNCGEYNIGGVPNSIWDKLFTLIFALVVSAAWYGVFSIAPFSISIN